MTKVLVYTVHKAASMFLHRLSTDVTSELGLNYYSINNEKYRNTIKEMSWKCFIQENSGADCFGPIRAGAAEPIIPENWAAYSIILHLRDPRDVLTSLFFSHTFSHPTREDGFNPTEVEREKWEQEGIDKFVLKKMPTFKERYQHLCANLLGKENVVLLKYEEMVANYDIWLEKFLLSFASFTPVTRKKLGILSYQYGLPEIYETLYDKHKDAFRISSEDKYAHKRQVTPGDHKRKLQAETITILNSEFQGILSLLDYSSS